MAILCGPAWYPYLASSTGFETETSVFVTDTTCSIDVAHFILCFTQCSTVFGIQTVSIVKELLELTSESFISEFSPVKDLCVWNMGGIPKPKST